MKTDAEDRVITVTGQRVSDLADRDVRTMSLPSTAAPPKSQRSRYSPNPASPAPIPSHTWNPESGELFISVKTNDRVIPHVGSAPINEDKPQLNSPQPAAPQPEKGTAGSNRVNTDAPHRGKVDVNTSARPKRKPIALPKTGQ